MLDIGNSAIKGGLFENGFLARTFRMGSRRNASVSAYRHALRHHAGEAVLERVGIVSVVPELSRTLSDAVRLELMVLPELVHVGMTAPIRIGYRTPDTLGADRLAAAVAARSLYGIDGRGKARGVVVIDAGTAVTFEAIDARGQYRGGAIAPGPALVQGSLAQGTASLPRMPLELPRRAVGRSTREALQSGVMFGLIDATAGMIGRFISQLRGKPYVVATGGWGELLHDQLPAIDHYDPNLVLYGGQILLKANPLHPRDVS